LPPGRGGRSIFRSVSMLLRRALCVFGLVVFVGDLGIALHVATVPHMPCTEHGGFVHAEGAEGVAAAGGAPDPTHTSVDVPARPAEAEAHAHCPACSLTRRRLAVTRGGPSQAARLERFGATPVGSEPAPPFPLHLLSPGRSPPA